MCGQICEDSSKLCRLNIIFFDGDKVGFDHEKHESDVMAEYYCDTRGIIVVNELDYNYLSSIFPKSLTEQQARSYLSDRGYKLLC